MSAQTYHHKNLKSQLIEKGLKLLDTEGYERFSLRKVAKMCGVSQTAPYRHFHSKDELISAITTQALIAFGNRLDAAAAMHPDDPKSQLKEMGVAYVRFYAENPEYLRLLFLSDVSLRAHFTKDETVREHYNSFHILQDVTARYVAAYPDFHLTQNELIVCSWGLVHGISTLIATGEIPGGEAMMQAVDKIIRGLF